MKKLVLTLVALFVASTASAVVVRVSQESAPGAGDFDANILGFVTSYDTLMTITDFYDYGNPNNASYNGENNGGPAGVDQLSQTFLVNASDGLSLVMLHDLSLDGTGGNTRTRWNLLGGDTAGFPVVDDPNEGVSISMGGTQFDSTKNWIGCCTDGYAIGSLDGSWEMRGQFLTVPSGITRWQVTSGDGNDIGLILTPGRRVRLDAVPEPGTVALMALGVLALGVARRRRNKN